MKHLPKAIYNELIEGLILLDNLNLSFAPRTLDDLNKTATAWEIALCVDRQWDEEIDAGRLTKAFLAVAQNWINSQYLKQFLNIYQSDHHRQHYRNPKQCRCLMRLQSCWELWLIK